MAKRCLLHMMFRKVGCPFMDALWMLCSLQGRGGDPSKGSRTDKIFAVGGLARGNCSL